MRWIYLSPHLDDIVLSCGGMVWQQVQAGDVVEIWTIFSGDAPPGPLAGFAQELHARWQTGPEASAVRRAERQKKLPNLRQSAEICGQNPPRP